MELNDYLSSTDWLAVSGRYLLSRQPKCEKCGLKTENLSVLHRTYMRLGSEISRDLIALCTRCTAKIKADCDRRGWSIPKSVYENTNKEKKWKRK